MDVDWTDAEKHDLGFTLSGHAGGNTLNAALAVASRAVSLFLARASGQVKDDTAWLRRHVGGDPGSSDAAISRLSALAQEAVALKTKGTLKERLLESVTAQREELKGNVRAIRAEVERLKDNLESAREDVATNQRVIAEEVEKRMAAESRLAAIRERAMNKVEAGHRLRMLIVYKEPNRAWSAAKYEDRALEFAQWLLEGDEPNPSTGSNGSGDAPQEAKSAAQEAVELAGAAGLPVRIVPGRYPCSATCTHDDAANHGHPERVKERSEDFIAASRREARIRNDGKQHGRIDGAEAMRAALLMEAKAACDQHGVGWLYQHLKRRFEGATT